MYDLGIKKFNEFCKEHNVLSSAPIDQTMICYFVSYLNKAGFQASSIKVYLAAIQHMQIARTGTELEHSKMPILKILQSGIRRTQALLPKQSLTRLPITQEEDIIMLWAASALCFFCMGELTMPNDTNYCTQKHLSLGDIAINSHCNPTVLRISSRCPKQTMNSRGCTFLWGKQETISAQ